MEPINLVISTDARGALGAVVAARSIATNAQAGREIRIFLVHSGISQTLLADMTESLRGCPSQTSVYPVHFCTDRVHGVLRSSSLPAMAYARLFVGEILPPECHRCLYVDIDTITVADISSLYGTDMKGRTIAAARNYVNDDGEGDFARLGERGGVYFNSGVMLIDLERWRTLSVGMRALEYARKAGPKLILHDQDALNIVLSDDWLEFSQEWNWWFGTPPVEMDVKLFHCAMSPKPWHADYSGEFRDLFRSFLKETPFAGKVPHRASSLARFQATLKRRIPYLPAVWQRLEFLLRGRSR